jgi:hypothetical protein
VKATWATTFVNDVKALSAVICATAEKGACIKALDPDNICALLEDPRDIYLARTCVEALCGDNEPPSLPMSAFWTACWALFRFNPSCYCDLRPKIDEGKMLYWASVNGYGLRTCIAGSEVVVNDRLMALLREFSFKMQDDADFLHAIWGNQFAEYLTSCELDSIVLMKLAATASKFGYKSLWPRLMHLLCKVYAGDASVADCEELLQEKHASFFASLPSPVTDQLFIERLCSLADGVPPPVKFQEYVLTSPVELTWREADVAKYLDMLADGVRRLAPERILLDSAAVRKELRSRGVAVSLEPAVRGAAQIVSSFSADIVFNVGPNSPASVARTPAQATRETEAFAWFRNLQKDSPARSASAVKTPAGKTQHGPIPFNIPAPDAEESDGKSGSNSNAATDGEAKGCSGGKGRRCRARSRREK